uniref:Major facilitator superfamily (MFS) profile domain-containing protein n=1 Tax=Megaselia scalaris TaxID=36166 RepID=T1H2T1_MEGSC
MELVGSSKRTVCGISFQAVFAGGIMLVAGWGALINDRVILQVVYGLHALILIPHWWIMDESPRWLWMQGRKSEAIDIVAKAGNIENFGTNFIIYYKNYLKNEKLLRISFAKILDELNSKNLIISLAFTIKGLRL